MHLRMILIILYSTLYSVTACFQCLRFHSSWKQLQVTIYSNRQIFNLNQHHFDSSTLFKDVARHSSKTIDHAQNSENLSYSRRRLMLQPVNFANNHLVPQFDHEDYYYSCTPSILQLPSVSNKWPSMYLTKASNNDDDGDTELEYEDSDDQAIVVESKDKNESDDEQTATFKLKDLMLGSIRWYREYLSPIMPPNCRFQPSCSVYAIDAITKFGPIRGGILTAWRILRCNPIGGSGYDPPQWPPVNYFTSR